jgi:hypothetical protein
MHILVLAEDFSCSAIMLKRTLPQLSGGRMTRNTPIKAN